MSDNPILSKQEVKDLFSALKEKLESFEKENPEKYKEYYESIERKAYFIREVVMNRIKVLKEINFSKKDQRNYRIRDAVINYTGLTKKNETKFAVEKSTLSKYLLLADKPEEYPYSSGNLFNLNCIAIFLGYMGLRGYLSNPQITIDEFIQIKTGEPKLTFKLKSKEESDDRNEENKLEEQISKPTSFILIKGKDIKPPHVFEAIRLEDNFREDLYYERKNLDGELKKLALSQNHILIIGKAGSGKTRAFFEFFKLNMEGETIAIIDKFTEINKAINELDYVVSPSVFFFDDINKILNDQQAWELIDKILKKGNRIFATCWKNQISRLRNERNDLRVLFSISTIEIEPLDEKKKKIISNELKISDQDTDDTIGSFFMKSFPTMQQRFNDLPLIGREILRSLKCLLYYMPQRNVNIESVRSYIYKRYNWYHTNEKSPSPADFDISLNFLITDGFIIVSGNISIEEVYLNKFIYISNQEIVDELIKYSPDIFTFSRLIQLSESYEKAKKLYILARQKKVQSNVHSITFLISISPDYETALGWYKEIKKSKLALTVVTFSSLISISPDYETALGWYKEIKKSKLAPDVVTFSSLRNKSIDVEFQRLIKITLLIFIPEFLFKDHFLNKMIGERLSETNYKKFVEKYKNFFPDDSVLLFYASSLERIHKPDSTRLAYELASEVKEKNSNCYNVLGNCLSCIGNWDESLTMYKKAILLEKNSRNKSKYHKNIASMLICSQIKNKIILAKKNCYSALKFNKHNHHAKILLFLLLLKVDNIGIIGEWIDNFKNKFEISYKSLKKALKSEKAKIINIDKFRYRKAMEYLEIKLL